jgi:hypothetical protein
VRFIRMSQELSEGLDYPSKLSREPTHIARLIADGEAQAAEFLGTFDESGRAVEPVGDEAIVEDVENHGPPGHP